jgi:hypothetical protein
VPNSDSPAEPQASRVAFLRHPLLVGAAVAAIGAVFASLLIPSITQVTQDRPKELELKRAIVEGIAEATAVALNRGVALARGDLRAAGGQAGEGQLSVYRRVYGDWLVSESTVDAQVTTYFSRGGARSRAAWTSWRALKTGITYFLQLSTVLDPTIRKRAQTYLKEYLLSESDPRFRAIFGNPNTLIEPAKARNVARSLAELLEFERDAVTVKIVDAPAAGFRHSPWSLQL